ncbi:LacI family DNA-binding transcriptional regulator [Mesobacillus foraminis]|uniref:LacI family transcriptional regulator n=1 Tax=Mesobacillus foraminis TaxID=279826 RepID=A0A4R2B783_9BACI|nr:LacI family DNA-binding transcriptional regulator [Mesobacillus foraminis]TCN22568.1 LacI family transcriptional regulator [Mesobacillus foraminis]
MATIKDIAKLSKVSAATVSRVLNGDESITVQDQTRQRIYQASKELGYKTIQERRNQQQMVISKKYPATGIILCLSYEEELSDPYFLSIRQGIEEELIKQGISTTTMIRLHDKVDYQKVRELDGMIIVGRINEEAIKKVSCHSKNIVYINHSPDDDIYDSVVVDFQKATERALQHLLKAGYKRIGYIGGVEREHLKEKTIIGEDLRFTTYEKVMKSVGFYQPSYVFIGEYTMTQGYELMKKAVKQKNVPEAFFIASDPMAIGALRALQELKVSVPSDIAIVSFDDIEMAEFCSTPLTTVKVHTKEMGQTGVKLLLDRINGRELPLKVTVPTELVIRQSCGTNK